MQLITFAIFGYLRPNTGEKHKKRKCCKIFEYLQRNTSFKDCYIRTWQIVTKQLWRPRNTTVVIMYSLSIAGTCCVPWQWKHLLYFPSELSSIINLCGPWWNVRSPFCPFWDHKIKLHSYILFIKMNIDINSRWQRLYFSFICVSYTKHKVLLWHWGWKSVDFQCFLQDKLLDCYVFRN